VRSLQGAVRADPEVYATPTLKSARPAARGPSGNVSSHGDSVKGIGGSTSPTRQEARPPKQAQERSASSESKRPRTPASAASKSESKSGSQARTRAKPPRARPETQKLNGCRRLPARPDGVAFERGAQVLRKGSERIGPAAPTVDHRLRNPSCSLCRGGRVESER